MRRFGIVSPELCRNYVPGIKGREKGRYAVNASGNWRITFGWDGRHAIEVDLEDYH